MDRLYQYLQTLIPAWGESGGRESAIRTLRLVLAMVMLLGPVYGWAYHVTDPGATDPFWVRAVMAAVSLALLVASYALPSAQRNAKRLLIGVTVGVLVWSGWLSWVNALDPGYTVGYTFVVVGMAMVYSMVWNRPGPFSLILVLAFVISVVVALSVDPAAAQMSPWLFLLSVGSCKLAVFFAFSGRLVIGRDLKRSQARLSAAERIAGTGTWSTHLPTGRRTWSRGLYDILGMTPTDETPPSLHEFVVPEQRELVERLNDRLYADGTTGTHRLRVVRPDGAVRTLQTRVELTRDPGGRPRSVHGVALDVTEQVAREAELADARDAAEAAAAAQASFLSNMSHEIRTPLTAIIGFAQMLQMEAGPELQDLADPIQVGGERLLGTLNSVLDLARMDSGETHIERVPTDVVTAVAPLLETYRTEAEAKGLQFEAAIPSELLLILADAPSLQRVVENLLSNAVTFTVAGGVRIRVRRAGAHAEIVVEDSGIGMDVSFVETQLFQPFQQASNGWDRTYEGTGLGLTLSHRLVELMEGTIEVESEKGYGSRFTVAFPLATPGDGLASSADRVSVSAPAAA